MSVANLSAGILPLEPKGSFHNEPATDFEDSKNADAMKQALARVGDMLGREYAIVIDGERLRTREKIESLNPARPGQLVGLHQKAGAELAERAIDAALNAYQIWRFVAAEQRAALLLRSAEIIRARKFEFCAWLLYEVGKNWAEAAADVSEAIDFLEFYAREALRLARATPQIQYPGERDELLYLPLGVGVVISPWNFPLAIMAGMTSAAIVTGNTVVVKPSSDSPTIAALFLGVLEEAGMPPGVVNVCPGSGETFGRAIVEHPKTRFIAFTGSRDTGLDIHARAAQAKPGQIWIKRSILEMGGKNSIVASSDCDIDDAVAGVVASAFGFSGQKCSACSRAVVEDSIYETFLKKLEERVHGMRAGDPLQNRDLGPVINAAARKKILSYIEIGKSEGRLLTGGHAIAEPEGGYYLEPTVFADVTPGARIAQEEIFGPALAVIRATDYNHALEIANNTEYGLTGSVYSRDRRKLDHARRAFHTGNLYFNRKSTGAMVGAHPFGGFNMSGTDSKAGGPDYLYLFTQAKSVAEKL
jgi:1-pyrroline-5-carboxylate dehydrogenase